MIKIVDIKKAFGENEVIKGITTTFETGKCNLIIGRSGAGKTVLLKILVGLIQPDQGEIWFDDINVLKLNKKEKPETTQFNGHAISGLCLV